MSRKPLMAGNWKMHLNHLEAIALVQKVAFLLKDDDYAAVDAAVLPPFTDLRSVQTLVDGTFPLRSDITKGYIIAINTAFSGELVEQYIARVKGLSQERAQALIQPVKLEVRYLYNQEVKSAWTIAPALVMFVLTLAPPLLTANFACGFVAIHLRHLTIHEDQVVVGLHCSQKRFTTILGSVGFAAEPLQDPRQNLQVHAVVFGDKDAQRGRCFHGWVCELTRRAC